MIMKEFKVGDKVTCLLYGKGEVVKIRGGETYLVSVDFENGNYESYTEDGRFFEDGNPVLFPGHVEFEIKTKSVRRFKKGDLVWYNISDNVLMPYIFVAYKNEGECELNNCYIGEHEQTFTFDIEDVYETPKEFFKTL